MVFLEDSLPYLLLRNNSIIRGTGTHPNGQIGITTVGAVRQVGGDVVRTTGRSPHHATVTELTPDQTSRLLTPTTPNPTREA